MMIQLNERWRIVESDDGPPYRQWVLQRLAGGNWKPKSFCQTRTALLRAINEKIIHADYFYPGGKAMPVQKQALDMVRNLPERVPQRETKVERQIATRESETLSSTRIWAGEKIVYDKNGDRLIRIWGPNTISDFQLHNMGLKRTGRTFPGGEYYVRTTA
jgi:hypothetical protein